MESGVSHYIIETLDDSEENNLILDGNTVVICSENGEQTEYLPCGIENGQVILRRVDEIPEYRLEKLQQTVTAETKSDDGDVIFVDDGVKKGRVYANPSKQRKKMSYENEFKPCMLPPNRGGMKGIIRYGRKHLIIDQQIMISPREFKAQLNNTNDLVMKPELAPCTKQQMRHMLTGITRLFAYPAHKMPNKKLLQLYVTNCTSRKQPNVENFNDMKLLPLGYKVEVDTTKIKRITRKRRYPEAEEYIRQQRVNEDDSEQSDDMKQLLEAANTASADHGYTNKIKESPEPEKDIKEEPIYIMETMDENGMPNSIEVLLQAAAVETVKDEDGQEYQQVALKDDPENGLQRIYILQQDTDEILCMPTEYVLP